MKKTNFKTIVASILMFAIVLCLFSFANKGSTVPDTYKKIKTSQKYVYDSDTKEKTLSKKMYNYQCKKCGTALQNDKTPNSLNCPSGHFHEWTNLGEVGNINYQCKKCGLFLRSKSTPSSLNCRAGHFHQWSKL